VATLHPFDEAKGELLSQNEAAFMVCLHADPFQLFVPELHTSFEDSPDLMGLGLLNSKTLKLNS
jgi:hypothetical protein